MGVLREKSVCVQYVETQRDALPERIDTLAQSVGGYSLASVVRPDESCAAHLEPEGVRREGAAHGPGGSWEALSPNMQYARR